ncbi:MAG: hypothetical protein IJ124_02160, partial [Clostridia bacterium]|nr:hypothetical protein [Clostridia bacterium]
LQAIRAIVEETFDRKFDEVFDKKLAPLIKDVESIKVAVLEIDGHLNDIKAVVAQNSYDIARLKSRIA